MLRKFLRDPRGSVLQIFAVALVPLLVATGGVIDYTNAFDQRSLVQDALDAAALAAGKQVGLMTTDELKEEAESFYLANVGTTKITNIPELTTTINGSTVDVNTTLHVPTYFLGLIGLSEFVFNLHTQVTVAMGTLEVAMALDNSGSMCATANPSVSDCGPNSQIAALRTAAANLATTLHNLGATSTKPDPVKIALAPFAASVNVGSQYANAAWMDTGAKGTYHADAQKAYGASATTNNFTLFNSLKDSSGNAISWGGCVEERPMPYDVSDDEPSDAGSPSTEEKKTLFVPMFAADDPDPWTCVSNVNNWPNVTVKSACSYEGSSYSSRRINSAPTGAQSFNNYLPDAGDATTCWRDETLSVSIATPALFTRNGHGFTIDTELRLYATGSLPSGLSTETSYYVSSVPSANTFRVSTVASSAGNTFTVTMASPALVTRNSHGLSAGTVITLSTTGSLPTGLSANTDYYVAAGTTSNNFKLTASAAASATISVATPAVVTQNSHGLTAGSPVTFSTTGSLPTGITAGTTYYVATSSLATNNFRLSPTASPPTATIATGANTTITSNSHGFSAGDPIVFTTTGSLPTGITANTVYYVSANNLNTNNFRISPTSTTPTATITTGSPATINSGSHGLTAGTTIVFTTTGSLPSGISAGTTYYVISSGLQQGSFRISTSSGGSAVNASGSQSGTHRFQRTVVTSGSQSGTHRVQKVIVTSGSQSGTHSLWKLVTTSGSQSGTHRYRPYVNTSGSQSGTHRFTRVANWTCQSGSANCNDTGDGKSFEQAFGGLNVSGEAQCKYGSAANKATVSSITVGGIPGGPNFMCTTTAVTPLTPSLETITNAINAQQAIGATNITAGLMWGWRVLSPGAPFTNGRSYDDNENQKILVLMTDGANTYYPPSNSSQIAMTSITKSWYGAWGYVSMGHLGSTSTTTSTLVTAMNARTALACANVKAAGIKVYTIAFNVGDAATIQLLQDCATEPAMAYQSGNNAELLAAFNAIGDDISLLRIAQ